MAPLQRLTIAPTQLQTETLTLTPEQAHYLRRVLRLKSGDRFIANAPDHPWLAALTETLSAQLIQALPSPPPLPVHIHLLAALPKTGFDEVVRQSTELGVGSIWPILSDRTLLQPSGQKCDRWQRIAQEATEQCERASVPTIHPPSRWADASQRAIAQARYIGAARAETQHLLKAIDADWATGKLKGNHELAQVAIALGPEGGWTDTELDWAIAQGYQPVSLGSTILRAVTAPLAAIALIMAKYESL